MAATLHECTGGWFLKTTEQWRWKRAFQRRNRSARVKCGRCRPQGEQRIGIPAKLHYRLCVDQLGNCCLRNASAGPARLDWAMVRRLLNCWAIALLSPPARGNRGVLPDCCCRARCT